jgi:hypothetical protein
MCGLLNVFGCLPIGTIACSNCNWSFNTSSLVVWTKPLFSIVFMPFYSDQTHYRCFTVSVGTETTAVPSPSTDLAGESCTSTCSRTIGASNATAACSSPSQSSKAPDSSCPPLVQCLLTSLSHLLLRLSPPPTVLRTSKPSRWTHRVHRPAAHLHHYRLRRSSSSRRQFGWHGTGSGDASLEDLYHQLS